MALRSDIRYKVQKCLKSEIDARNHYEEYENDYKNHARGLEHLGECGPRYPFQFGKGFLEFSAHADEDVGLFNVVFV